MRLRQHGFSLVEIMVGVAIGIVGFIAITQVVITWGRHAQTTSAGGDAQVAGTLALFGLERDLKQAGVGFNKADSTRMGCTVAGNDSTRAAPPFSFLMAPAVIASGANASTDEIDVLYGNSSFFVSEGIFTVSTATTKKINLREGFKAGDLAIVVSDPSLGPVACQLIEVTDTSNPDGYTISHGTAAYNSFYAASGASAVTPRFNAVGTGASFPSGTIYDLGPQPLLDAWRVDVVNAKLTRTDLIHNTTASEISDGVVAIKAQYGIDVVGNGQIADANWVTTAPTDWSHLLAMRVGILVRSRQFESSADPTASAPTPVTPTAANPTWFGTPFLMLNVNGTTDSYSDGISDPNNWRYYRYRVYERTIPLRNMLWGSYLS